MPINQALNDAAIRYIRTQKERIKAGNLISAQERGDDPYDIEQYDLAVKWHYYHLSGELAAYHEMTGMAEAMPIYHHVLQVPGMGETFSSLLIASTDIYRAKNVSSLWRYYGMGIVQKTEQVRCDLCEGEGEVPNLEETLGLDLTLAPMGPCPECGGKGTVPAQVFNPDGTPWMIREKRVRFEKSHFNQAMKPIMFNIGNNFIRSRSTYEPIYREYVEYYTLNRPQWQEKKGWKMHVHLAAISQMTKRFVGHLWVTWRMLYGLPICLPYELEPNYPKHSRPVTWNEYVRVHKAAGLLLPQDYGWPEPGEMKYPTAVSWVIKPEPVKPTEAMYFCAKCLVDKKVKEEVRQVKAAMFAPGFVINGERLCRKHALPKMRKNGQAELFLAEGEEVGI